MNVYMYQAALFCEACGESIRERLDAEGKAPADPTDESSYDSDDYPKGPFPDGGGESDTPQHCEAGADCLDGDGETGLFLENPLTPEGRKYVQEQVQEDQGDSFRVSSTWADFYGVPYLVSIDPKQERFVRDEAAEHFRPEVVFEHGQWWVKLGSRIFAVVDTDDGIDFEEV